MAQVLRRWHSGDYELDALRIADALLRSAIARSHLGLDGRVDLQGQVLPAEKLS